MKDVDEFKFENTFVPSTIKELNRSVESARPVVRLGYFILDSVLFYILFIISFFVLFFLLEYSNLLWSFKRILSNELMYLLFVILYFHYYALSEYFFNGTFGKLICGYTVINLHADKITIRQAFLRTIIRFIPFEFFSCVSDLAWHDKWSQTYVVDRREKEELQKLLHVFNGNTDILD